MASKNIRNCGLRLLGVLRGVNLRGAIILGLKINFLEGLYRLHLRIDNYKLRIIKGIKKKKPLGASFYYLKDSKVFNSFIRFSLLTSSLDFL